MIRIRIIIILIFSIITLLRNILTLVLKLNDNLFFCMLIKFHNSFVLKIRFTSSNDESG